MMQLGHNQQLCQQDKVLNIHLNDVASTTTPSGSDNYLLRHCIEDNLLQHLDIGTANAKTFTVLFWVRSSKKALVVSVKICQQLIMLAAFQ